LVGGWVQSGSVESLRKASSSKTTLGTLLRRLSSCTRLEQGLQEAAQALLGTPYVSDPLGGGPQLPERFSFRLDGFDCVTFVETCLALARSRRARDFEDDLRRLRYRNGRVSWPTRLHYFSDWLRANQARGAIRIRTAGVGSQAISTRLALVPSLPARKIRLLVVPKTELERAWRRIGPASIVAFASTRARLDFFHTGLLFGEPSAGRVAGLRLCHASRQAGRVIQETLGDFLKRNRMRGIAFAAPLARQETLR
jgi:hypothetical protein